MHLSVYLTEPERRAKLTIYSQEPDGTWLTHEWHGQTLESAAWAAKLDIGKMDDAYDRLVELGIEQVSLTSYTAKGMDTNDPAKAKLWSANVRHPNNSGHSHTGKGNTAAAALLDAARIESERQHHALQSSLAYHEREANRLRQLLNPQERGT